MDFLSLLMPGAQNLATAMLGDAWNVTRDAIARRWGRGDQTETDKVAGELDESRSNALAMLNGGQMDERELKAFLAGYILASSHNDLARVQVLMDLQATPNPPTVRRVGNLNNGNVEKLTQIEGNVHGGIHM
ncbi:hypothetical protein [Catenulispora pinisilvae]|uniref:hypothetical protein n=1 Tax=Catenulispora pinisilvae TaxID=2705253 RepID=UPI00189232F4|nr:hypothetical protein [Catenulispora pinisilvae]